MARFFIHGEYIEPNGRETTSVLNPANNEEIGRAAMAIENDVDDAVASARSAFEKWWATPGAKRGEILFECAEAVHKAEDALAASLTREQGKPLREAHLEINRFCHTIGHYAGLGKNLRGGYVPNLDENAHGIILKRPLGVVAAIVPWNFPTTLLSNKLAPALVTGNTVVAKPAGTTPLTTLRIAEIFAKAGLPAGVFNVITGGGSTAGRQIIRHPDVRKVGFTGATETGKIVMKDAAEGVKRVTLELGGSDPMIVCDDADIDGAVSAASVGRFFNCGQACLAIKRVFVFDKVADEFIQKLAGKAAKLKVGPGDQPGIHMGPLHTPGQREEVEAQVADAVKRGAKVLTGGKRPEGAAFDKGNFYLPTVLTDVDPEARVAREEVFGPAIPVWRVKDLDEALGRANDCIYGLGSSVWTRDLSRAHRAAERLEAGYTWINSIQKIYDELPFGGFKQSGFGLEHGIEALDYYMATKSVVVRI